MNYTYYNAKTKDAIFSLPLPPSTGFFAQAQNAAEFENKGHEIDFDIQPIRNEYLTWDIGLVWAKNDNLVTKLPGAERVILGGFTSALGIATEGHPLGVFWTTDFYRFGRGSSVGGVSIDGANSGWTAGDLYIGSNGYPIEDPTARIFGDPNPDWTGSLRTSVTLRGNLRLSGLLSIKSGGDMWNGTKGALYYFGTHKDTEVFRDAPDYVFEGAGPGAGTGVILNGSYRWSGPGSGFTGPGAQFIEDAGYVKLRELAAEYTIRNSFTEQLGISSISLRFSARNLKTWTDYSGIDPESNLWGTSNLRGIDYFTMPQTKSYTFTLRISY